MRALVWFRSDLRTRDNTALYHAVRAADDGVVGIFAVCAEQWKQHDWGAPRVSFQMANVRALSESLEKMNIPLRIIVRPAFVGLEKSLLALAEETACDALYFNDEYEINESRRDERVQAAFERAGRSVHRFTDQVVLRPGDVLTKQGNWPVVFTPFKRAWISVFNEDRDQGETLAKPRRLEAMVGQPDQVPDAVEGYEGSHRADLWPAGEDHAGNRLRSFIEGRIGGYHERRDWPSLNGTSTLSPYLAAGVLSPSQCLRAAINANHGRVSGGQKGIETWISELIWREFYRHLIVGFPRLCMGRAFKAETERIEWENDEEKFRAWREGATGYPIVDAAMRQLEQTGWMHNRLRMIVASFLTKDLWIDWRWGERHFMNHLVDGDFASNNGGWQWSASTGTDAQPYFRIFNPTSQSRRFDPDGDFIRRFVPELKALDAESIHDPQGAGLFAGEADQSGSYPEPIVDHKAARARAIEVFESLKT